MSFHTGLDPCCPRPSVLLSICSEVVWYELARAPGLLSLWQSCGSKGLKINSTTFEAAVIGVLPRSLCPLPSFHRKMHCVWYVLRGTVARADEGGAGDTRDSQTASLCQVYPPSSLLSLPPLFLPSSFVSSSPPPLLPPPSSLLPPFSSFHA
eukprot:3204553-Rhodomonas_salina.1